MDQQSKLKVPLDVPSRLDVICLCQNLTPEEFNPLKILQKTQRKDAKPAVLDIV